MERAQGTEGDEAVSAELGERVRAIVAAAESMAGAVRSDAEQFSAERRREAEAEAQRYLDDARRRADELVAERIRRISELSDLVVRNSEAILDRFDQAGQVRAQLEGLVRELGQAAERVAREPAPEHDRLPAAGSAPDDHAGGGEDPGEEGPPADEPAAGSPTTRADDDEARLVALQMAVSGRSRGEVAAHLEREFDVHDPEAEQILDAVFAERGAGDRS